MRNLVVIYNFNDLIVVHGGRLNINGEAKQKLSHEDLCELL